MISLDKHSEENGAFIKLLPIQKNLALKTFESKSSVEESHRVGRNNANTKFFLGPMSSQEGDKPSEDDQPNFAKEVDEESREMILNKSPSWIQQPSVS